MEVTFHKTRKKGDKYEEYTLSEGPKQILQMQPMPAGCFTVSSTPPDPDHPESIASIDAVLFLAICTFDKITGPVVCYGVSDSVDKTIYWRDSDETEVYFYGPYKQTCELIGETPRPFLEWYVDQKKGDFAFDIAIPSLN